MAPQQLETETSFSSIGVLFAQLGRTAKRWFSAALAPLDLKPIQVGVLRQLGDGPMSQQALGDALDLDASNLVALLNDLEDKNLIARRRDPGDRRRHIVEVTETGIERMGDVRVAVASVEERLLSALDEQQRAQLQELLATIAASLCATEPCDEAAASVDEEGC